MQRSIAIFCFSFLVQSITAQLKWINVDSLYQPLPSSVHVYRNNDSLGGKPNIAYYLVADLKDKHLLFDADTTKDRRLTPGQFYEKNKQPLVVVNCTFFSFETNRSLNAVIKNGQMVSVNRRVVKGKGNDSTHLYMPHLSAIGISGRKADVAWIKADSTATKAFASQTPPVYGKIFKTRRGTGETTVIDPNDFSEWNMETAVGGGPVLLQEREIKVTNEEEMMFTGKAINDKHPRTAMGYTKNKKLIILVIQGRYPGIAEGATLIDEAQILKDLGCWEALNLDGGGSSCMLVNGKTTITPSEKGIQRPVPAVFLIKLK
jgi:hypothetical protein